MADQVTKVDLRVWGSAEVNAAFAVEDAESEAAARGWQIAHVQTSTGGRNPLRPRDYSALALRQRAYWAWAAYARQSDD